MKNLYKDTFRTLLEAELNIDLAKDIENNLDKTPGEDGVENSETDALASTLDSDVTPADYLSDPATDKALQQQIEQRNKEIASVIEGWARKIDDFVEFLNGAGSDSLQTILSKAQPGTLFAKVQSNVTRKLANNAAELAATAETLRSFVGTYKHYSFPGIFQKIIFFIGNCKYYKTINISFQESIYKMFRFFYRKLILQY